MKNLCSVTFTAFLIICLAGCASKTEVYLLSRKEVPFQISKLETGTTLKIIAFSGSKQSDKQHTYYSQFITIQPSTGDTIRVLTPLISVGETEIYTTPALYNQKKGIETAVFEPEDDSFFAKINLSALDKEMPANPEDFEKLNEKSNAEEQVVLRKGDPLFESDRYKTVVGALHFDIQPW